MAVLCTPRRIRSSDRGKGDRLKCGICPAIVGTRARGPEPSAPTACGTRQTPTCVTNYFQCHTIVRVYKIARRE